MMLLLLLLMMMMMTTMTMMIILMMMIHTSPSLIYRSTPPPRVGVACNSKRELKRRWKKQKEGHENRLVQCFFFLQIKHIHKIFFVIYVI